MQFIFTSTLLSSFPLIRVVLTFKGSPTKNITTINKWPGEGGISTVLFALSFKDMQKYACVLAKRVGSVSSDNDIAGLSGF